MTSPLTDQDRSASYGAAVLGLRPLDAGETTPRRFGADAEARWTQFAGALARYSLSGALARIVNEAEGGDAPATLLVVSSHADGSAPSIDGRLPVPAPLPSQRLVMPDAWLANAHRAESSP